MMYKMNYVNLKVLSDIDCDIYVDNEFVSTAKKGIVSVVSLEVGEYWVQFIASFNPNCKIEKVLNIEHHKVEKVEFLENLDKHSEWLTDEIIQFDSTKRTYINTLSGKALFPYQYDNGEIFQEGVAKVQKCGKWGYINKLGNEVIKCEYDEIYNFTNHKALVRKNGKYGYIDEHGIEIVPCVYNTITPWENGAIVCYNGKWGCIDTNGRVIVACEYDEFESYNNDRARVKKNGKCGYINGCGQEIIPCIYDVIEPSFNNLIRGYKDGRYEYIDDKANIIVENIPCIYEGVGRYNNTGLFAVKINSKWGIIDKSNNYILPPVLSYNWVNVINTYLFAAYNGKWGIIDKNTKEILPSIYEEIAPINNELFIARLNSKWGIFDKSAKEIFPCIYGDIRPLGDELYTIELDGKRGIIDKDAKEILPCIYEDIRSLSSELFTTKLDGKMGLFDKRGQIIFPIYDSMNCYDDCITIKKCDKWGLCDLKGKIIIPCIYNSEIEILNYFDKTEVSFESVNVELLGINHYCGERVIDKQGREIVSHDKYKHIESFRKGTAVVQSYDGKYGMIDKFGNEIIPCQYKSILNSRKDIVEVKTSLGLVGWIDKRGKLIFPCMYKDIDYLQDYNLICLVDDFHKYALTDSSGIPITQFVYDSINKPFGYKGSKFLHVRKNGKMGVINNLGKEVVPCVYDSVSFICSSDDMICVKREDKYGYIKVE